MYSQSQSFFFSKFPVEVRQCIQLEYLADYLRGHNDSADVKLDESPPRRGIDLVNSYSRRPSPLSCCCRRMYDEMRGDSGPFGPASLAVFTISPGHTERYPRMAVVAEGRFDWERICRLRFVNELNHANEESWQVRFCSMLRCSHRLRILEMDWNPKMSLMRRPAHPENLKTIREHPTLRAVRLRGNVPRSWVEGLRGVADKVVVVEPFVWTERVSEEEKKREKAIEEAVRSNQRIVDDQYALTQEDPSASTRMKPPRFGKLPTCRIQ